MRIMLRSKTDEETDSTLEMVKRLRSGGIEESGIKRAGESIG